MRDEKRNDHARIQGQGQEPMKVGNSTIFKLYLLPHFCEIYGNCFIFSKLKIYGEFFLTFTL